MSTFYDWNLLNYNGTTSLARVLSHFFGYKMKFKNYA